MNSDIKTYRFPKNIFMCHKTKGYLETVAKVRWEKLNPDYKFFLYDDKDCRDFLFVNYGMTHLKIFDYIPNGPIKADFWRICVLYCYGGVYLDADTDPFTSLDDFIEDGIDFLTATSVTSWLYNPDIIISNKRNEILKDAIDWYLNKYKNKDPYTYWDWSIVHCFRYTLKIEDYKREGGIFIYKGKKVQLIQEYAEKDENNVIIMDTAVHYYNGIKLFNSRSADWDWKTHDAI